jgi:hypothetical protein
MTKVVECIARHAERYRTLLVEERESRTTFTQAEAARVVARIDEVLGKIPAAIKQAEDRILHGNMVADSDKLLSLYESDTHVIFRGKSGAPVEFGNTLYIAESRDGFIVDFKYYKGRAPADSKMLQESLARCRKAYGGVTSVTGDRGFHSPDNTAFLEEEEVQNNILPKSPRLMVEALMDTDFREAQKRRAQTEGRIGILKNVFIGKRLAGNGFEHQHIEVAWSILTHNFWVLARMAKVKAKASSAYDKIKKTA